MKIDTKSHTAILIGSLNREFRNARRKGTFSVRDLYFLNCISKTLSFSCEIGMTEIQQRELSLFYFKVIASSDKFCVHEFQSEYYKKIENTAGLYVQTYEVGNTNVPEVSNFTIGNSGEIPEQGGIFDNTFDNTFE
jgi:hypothetical protein